MIQEIELQTKVGLEDIILLNLLTSSLAMQYEKIGSNAYFYILLQYQIIPTSYLLVCFD